MNRNNINIDRINKETKEFILKVEVIQGCLLEPFRKKQ